MTLHRMIFCLGLALATVSNALNAAPAQDLQHTLYLDTKDGRVTILLRPDLAPKHVAQIEALTKRGFYDGLVFHRVIDGFMAQTGDPTGTGAGKSDLPDIPAEFSAEPFRRGTVGMARSQDPDSANSQFFICFADAAFLNNKYTVVGEVISGMDAIDKIKKGAKEDNGAVTAPDKIVKMQLAADGIPGRNKFDRARCPSPFSEAGNSEGPRPPVRTGGALRSWRRSFSIARGPGRG